MGHVAKASSTDMLAPDVGETERVRWVGDRALLCTFGGDVAEANRSALACAEAIAAVASKDVEDVVPGARSVLVIFRSGAEPAASVRKLLDRESWPSARREGRTVEIPVRYGGYDGPDLAAVARVAGMTEDGVIRAHSAPFYVVGFIGFSPGFPYLIGMDERLATPRLDAPRPRVDPGSVGIGGAYTGIYPSATPGGWRLIGRTDVELFDPERRQPSLLMPGDRVRFVRR
jgi:KipI family sensor histidine kinase inhibitor